MNAAASTHRIAIAQIALCAAGVVVSAILTSFHYSEATTAALCTVAGGCETVNTSPYSTLGGIPVALIGLGAYLVVGGLAVASTRDWPIGETAPLMIFGLSLIGVLYSAYLTYLELFVIHAVCPWCVVSALLMTSIWILALVDVVRRRRLEAIEADA
ncbi:MAG TPA: vitamin K epoxide reductase family protein [Anaerolineae bacterium]|nr:vitamin K epoxide reductase family protein [Anaerolineae bacterium]